MKESQKKGSPFTRALMLHYPNDSKARSTNNEFMLGENILMAPVFEEGATSRDVYLPGPATWKHLWTGDDYVVDEDGMTLKDFAAPIGSPAVFTRDTSTIHMSVILADYYGEQIPEILS